MKNSIISFANRKMKHSPHYRQLSDADTPLSSERLVDKLPYPVNISVLAKDEVCIGFYENYLGEIKNGILITDRGLYFRTDVEWVSVFYQGIL